mmetsp:Transcript_24749/g.32321  ORF Transcript_24749/g.32321 Transcript_24749/m.32321 type:complete len:497 (+) Transcript_24749:31-1521(+)|eukprot:CAMPEP_0117756610 /NCGR_PEP_ID=MMETSP0947-20121206/14186_1 /TAXON_ID=44440 /ORGANISM="Chattonella subsalsa, Strain CCMP2191" /LENGTH=496 /DNA_ID=CAMNT_0005576241 /DNA_START=31 /DNA_END=1521 /DNA_ORIENTATION=+
MMPSGDANDPLVAGVEGLSVGDTTPPTDGDSLLKSQDSLPPPAPYQASPPISGAVDGWQMAWAAADSELPNAGMVVSVSQPELAGNFVNRHITYLVETQPNGWATRRRFSDFFWLRNTLVTRYPGLMIPSLPPKDIAGKAAGKSQSGFQSDYIRTRMRLLGIFLDQVVQVPYLRTDNSLLAFLSAQSEAEWTSQKQTTGQLTVLTDTSPGCNRWKEDISNVHLPPNVDRLLQETRERLNRMAQVQLQSAEASKELLESCREHCIAMARMNSSFQSMTSLESQLGQLGMDGAAAGGTGTADMMLIASEVISNWSQVEDFRPTILNSALFSALTYEHQQILALQNLIDNRVQAQRDLANAERVLKRHQEQLALMERGNPNNAVNTASFLNAFTNRGTLETDIAQDTNKIQVAEKSVGMITKGLIFSEIERFSITRQKMLAELLKQLSGSEFQYARRLAQIWQMAMEALNYDVQMCLDSAKHLIAVSATVGNLEDTAAV